ncbi:MAG: hypothetical protein ACRYE8_05405 [Janthinobacterium lividum]
MDHSPPCHPVIYELEPVKNINTISIFYYFLNTVDKPRYDPPRAFFNPRGQCLLLIILQFSLDTTTVIVGIL